MAIFRKKHLTIEAMQWGGRPTEELLQFLKGTEFCLQLEKTKYSLFVNTTEPYSSHFVILNSWVLKGNCGKYYVQDDKQFRANYEVD